MCGIVGIVGTRPVASDLIWALGELEYRGYDSAGLALSRPGMVVRKVVGRATDLREALGDDGALSQTGIAHTRWATHGAPDATNAHPHVYDGVAVVHNGIIENHATLKDELRAEGHRFRSATDSEVIPHLIARARMMGLDHVAAVRDACSRLQGAYAIAVLFADRPDRLLVTRRHSPLMVGAGAQAGAVASDPIALSGVCEHFIELEDDDLAVITTQSACVTDATGARVFRKWQPMLTGAQADMGDPDTPHTRREISQQPAALRLTLAELSGRRLPEALVTARRLTVLGCGSSLFAATAARGTIERLAGIPCDIEIASEFRYRESPIEAGTVGIVVSQSGETADTIAAMSRLRSAGAPIIAIVNVLHSTIARSADLVWPTQAGREYGVAATKSFTTQLAALLRLAVDLAHARGRDDAGTQAVELALAEAAQVCADTEEMEPMLAELARWVAEENEALFIGRGDAAAIAGEAALKLKELSYIRADAYAAGELKHGPIALIRDGSPVVVMAGSSALLPKIVANAEEVRARGAVVVVLTDACGARSFTGIADAVLALPGQGVSHLFSLAVAQQLIAYHAAVALERDVDRPRNLAKSVTVE